MAYNQRWDARTDDNHTDVLAPLKDIPTLSVCDLRGAGGGVPDALIGYDAVNYLFEIKRNDVPPSQSKLNPRQVEWHDGWWGQVTVVRTTDEILEVLGLG